MKKTHSTVAISGANGFLGTELVRHFATHDWQVIALVRQPDSAKHMKNVTFKKYDITKKLEKNLLKDVDVVIHTAYIKYDKAHPDAFEANVTGAKQLLENSKRHNVGKNILISTMSAHEDAVSIYGKQKLALEDLFLGAKGGLAIRSGLIMGNGGIVKQMSSFMKSKHAVPLIGGGKQPLQIIGVYDLATALEKASHSKATGILTIANPTVYTYKTFYEKLARSINAKVLFVPVPFNLLLYGFRLAALLKLPLGVGEDNLMGLKMLRSVDNKKDLKALDIKLDDLDTVLSKIKISG